MESIRELIEYCKREYGELAAIKWPMGQDVFQRSFNELEESASIVRRGLNADGFKKDHIAVIGHSSFDWLQAFFGITSGENTAVLLDPLLPDDELTELLIRSDSKAVFVDESKMALVSAKVFGGNLKTVFSGGAHLDPFYIEEFAKYGVNIYQGYGMSECSPVISTNTPFANKPGSVGKILKNARIKIVDGEILVRSTSVMTGYYQMPEETGKALEDGWLHTGDKGYVDEDGYLFINGRVKNLIILSNGENISPEEIENKLGLYPLIDEVVVTGEGNGLTARIYPDQDLVVKKKMDDEKLEKELHKAIDEYNSSQPTYRRIAHLIIRENPFRRNTTRKILRQYAAEDVPA